MKILSTLIFIFAVSVNASTFTTISLDDPGEGLNDPTVATPVGGNSGTTIGAQRSNCFVKAGRIWGAILFSDVDIKVEAEFNPLPGGVTWAVLGSAGPNMIDRDFSGAPIANTYYVQAQANSLAGSDLAPGVNDIGAEFNSDIGTAGCLPDSSWYYGFDGGTTGNEIDFLDTVLHEMGHGLGFLTLVDLASGAKYNERNDAYMINLYDKSLDKNYPDMTNQERINASTNTGNLFWNGAKVMEASSILTTGKDGDGRVLIYAPDPQESGSSVSHWDTSLSPDELMEPSATPTSDNRLSYNAFQDMGWNIIPEPAGIFLFSLFIIFIKLLRNKP